MNWKFTKSGDWIYYKTKHDGNNPHNLRISAKIKSSIKNNKFKITIFLDRSFFQLGMKNWEKNKK